jgi:hypothetical protein
MTLCLQRVSSYAIVDDFFISIWSSTQVVSVSAMHVSVVAQSLNPTCESRLWGDPEDAASGQHRKFRATIQENPLFFKETGAKTLVFLLVVGSGAIPIGV